MDSVFIVAKYFSVKERRSSSFCMQGIGFFYYSDHVDYVDGLRFFNDILFLFAGKEQWNDKQKQ